MLHLPKGDLKFFQILDILRLMEIDLAWAVWVLVSQFCLIDRSEGLAQKYDFIG